MSQEIVERINSQFLEYRNKDGFDEGWIGTPLPKKWADMKAYADRVRSDPFVPKFARTKILEYLDGRNDALVATLESVSKAYVNGLRSGKYVDSLATNHHWVHNKIADGLNEKGFGIQTCSDHVNSIRLAIQDHFEAYDPIKR